MFGSIEQALVNEVCTRWTNLLDARLAKTARNLATRGRTLAVIGHRPEVVPLSGRRTVPATPKEPVVEFLPARLDTDVLPLERRPSPPGALDPRDH